jgi:hypothetical protein
MSSEYPDVLGDLVEAQQRFEVKGVHYVISLQPQVISPGEAAGLRIWLQSCWDVPLQFSVSVHLPGPASSHFSLVQKQTDVPLEPAEVGEVLIPIACAPQTPSGQYKVLVTLQAKLGTRGHYIRSQKHQGQLGDCPLTFTSGMELARVLGVGFAARSKAEQQLLLQVEGAAQQGSTPDLIPTYVSHWTVAELSQLGKARAQVNERLIYVLSKMPRQALFLAAMEEGKLRFQQAALPLQLGEALFLAKILTYTAEYMLKQHDWQEALLVPAYLLAYRHGLPMEDPVSLVMRADYARMVRLATSFSFGMLRQRLQRDVWTMEEQLAVADLISSRLEQGGALPVEFLYLPLLLGSLIIASQVQMPGEQLASSLHLLTQARQKRAAELAVNPDLTALLDRLMQQ